MRPRSLTPLLVVAGLVAASQLPSASPTEATSSVADQAVTYQGNVTHAGSPTGDSLTPGLIKRWSRNLGLPTR
jgi:hypothetical protein